MCIYIYIYIYKALATTRSRRPSSLAADESPVSPNLPTKIISTKIARLKTSRKSPMRLGIPPLKIKILLESNPLKSRIVVRRLAVEGYEAKKSMVDHGRVNAFVPRPSGVTSFWMHTPLPLGKPSSSRLCVACTGMLVRS